MTNETFLVFLKFIKNMETVDETKEIGVVKKFTDLVKAQ